MTDDIKEYIMHFKSKFQNPMTFINYELEQIEKVKNEFKQKQDDDLFAATYQIEEVKKYVDAFNKSSEQKFNWNDDVHTSFIKKYIDLDHQMQLQTISQSYQNALQSYFLQSKVSPFMIKRHNIKMCVPETALEMKLFMNIMFYKNFFTTTQNEPMDFDTFCKTILILINGPDMQILCNQYQELLKHYDVMKQLPGKDQKLVNDFKKQVVTQKQTELTFMISDYFSYFGNEEKIKYISQFVNKVINHLSQYPSLVFDIFIDFIYFIIQKLQLKKYGINIRVTSEELIAIIDDRHHLNKMTLFRSNQDDIYETKQQINFYNELITKGMEKQMLWFDSI